MNKYAFILGRKHLLSIAELCNTLSGTSAIEEINTFALITTLDTPLQKPQRALNKLGGVIKICKVIAEIPKPEKTPQTQALNPNTIAEHFLLFFEKEFENHHGKINYGLSVYNFPQKDEELIKKILIGTKNLLKKTNIKSRFINKNFTPLKNAAIKSEKLITKGAEFCVINSPRKIYITQTRALQDFESYSHRDYDRPERDPRLGMLPPKLAQIMINLSGITKIETPDEPKERKLIFDPFCGIGTVLQEALLMGYSATGSDIDQKNITKTATNLKWIEKEAQTAFPQTNIFAKDATTLNTTDLPKTPDAVITESYLGPPVSQYPSEENIQKTFQNIEYLQTGFFRQLKIILKPGTPIIISLPAYADRGKIAQIETLPDKIKALGFTLAPLIPHEIIKKFNLLNHPADNLIYDRPQQIVARNIYKFTAL